MFFIYLFAFDPLWTTNHFSPSPLLCKLRWKLFAAEKQYRKLYSLIITTLHDISLWNVSFQNSFFPILWTQHDFFFSRSVVFNQWYNCPWYYISAWQVCTWQCRWFCLSIKCHQGYFYHWVKSHEDHTTVDGGVAVQWVLGANSLIIYPQYL